MGSSAVAAFVSHVTFWVLILYGWAVGELQAKAIALFLLLWIGARLGLPHLSYGAAMFPSFVAVLDIALVFIIFKGDVRLT
jgi:hypothetical protein